MTQDDQGRWRLKKEVSLGDVIALAAALMAVLMAFMSLRVTDLELDSRIRVVEITSNANSANVATTVQELKVELRRLGDKIDTLTARK